MNPADDIPAFTVSDAVAITDNGSQELKEAVHTSLAALHAAFHNGDAFPARPTSVIWVVVVVEVAVEVEVVTGPRVVKETVVLPAAGETTDTPDLGSPHLDLETRSLASLRATPP